VIVDAIASHSGFIGLPEIRSGFFLRLGSPKKTLGVLALYRGAEGGVTQLDRSFIDELCERIALTMTNLDLYRTSEEANRAKDQFLAIVSHELRTPLVSIIGWIDILLAKKLPSDRVENALRTIQRNAKLQHQLVEDILDFAGIASRRLSIVTEDMEL